MLKIGITGQKGFMGRHLYNSLTLEPKLYKLIDFQKCFFENDKKLDAFVSKCDVIVHLAALNRHDNEQIIYDTNVQITKKLIASLERVDSPVHVILSSSTQEVKDNMYGKSKKKVRELFLNWVDNSKGLFSGLIIPNVFGPFGKPNYNSFVATFCHKITNGENPEIIVDNIVDLIYVNDLVKEIISFIKKRETNKKIMIKPTIQIKVSKILSFLNVFKSIYQDKGDIPKLNSSFELNLFNTFRSYIDLKNHFPVKLTKHTDKRGSFIEIIRLGTGGQISFSTTKPGIIRGNHFHTRKIERFTVIKGKALIQLRKIGSNKVLDFYLDGNDPAYVDMPIWYTHNIKNVGDEVLLTNFWINEPYDPESSDTFHEIV